jgi:hypothetical protein
MTYATRRGICDSSVTASLSISRNVYAADDNGWTVSYQNQLTIKLKGVA